MKLQFPQNVGNSLTTRGVISFSWRTLLYVPCILGGIGRWKYVDWWSKCWRTSFCDSLSKGKEPESDVMFTLKCQWITKGYKTCSYFLTTLCYWQWNVNNRNLSVWKIHRRIKWKPWTFYQLIQCRQFWYSFIIFSAFCQICYIHESGFASSND